MAPEPIEDNIYDGIISHSIKGTVPKLGHSYTKDDIRMYRILNDTKYKVEEKKSEIDSSTSRYRIVSVFIFKPLLFFF